MIKLRPQELAYNIGPKFMLRRFLRRHDDTDDDDDTDDFRATCVDRPWTSLAVKELQRRGSNFESRIFLDVFHLRAFSVFEISCFV
jgi:hypothetical protein